MFENLAGLGYGVIVFALIIGVGSVVLYNFGGATGCSGATHTSWNGTSNLCYEPANTSNTASPSGAAYDNSNYLLGQLGESGLAGWTPAVIAISIGLLFLGAFMIGKGKSKGRY